jgi:catechol 2,3-dioxygenase-like lactoylglutathione lyase family enzyme
MTPDFQPSHLGICVRHLERSLRFYCDGLGFQKTETFEMTDAFGKALEVEGKIAGTSQFIRRGGMRIEFLAYHSPGTSGEPARRRNQLGITHLSFIVEDVDAAAKHLVACGGKLLPATRTGSDPAATQLVFVADPDGVRIELMSNPAELS